MATPELDLNEIVEEYYHAVRMRVRKKVPECDAEDVTQEIFLHLTRSIGSFKGESTFSTWFRRIELNRIADYYSRLSERRSGLADFVPTAAVTEATQGDLLIITELLSKLKERHEEVMWLRLWFGYSFSEIGTEVEVSYWGANSLYRRGIVKLREIMEKEQ